MELEVEVDTSTLSVGVEHSVRAILAVQEQPRDWSAWIPLMVSVVPGENALSRRSTASESVAGAPRFR